MLALIENEALKLIRRRRFAIIISILLVLLSVIAYSEMRQLERNKNREWRVDVQQQIARYQNRVRSGRIAPMWARSMKAEIARLQFYLDHDIDPEKPSAPYFTRVFANAAGFLLLPLLVAVLASDIISAEGAEGTDKLLLTRGNRRWKILTAKAAALFIFTTLTLMAGGLLAYAVSSIVLEPGGWTAPTFNGFRLGNAGVNLEDVRTIPLWQDTLIAYGLEWFSMLSVASVGLLLSVLFRSSAASIGTMLAFLIGGTILTRVSPDWTAGKYVFVSALPLADYYSGGATPYDGMSLTFCISLLAAWSVGSLITTYVIFTRRDVFG
jgi:ABC-2 type transport system permease protein